MKRKQKRAYGGTPIGISNPSEAIVRGNISNAKRKHEIESSNEWMDILGNTMFNTGMSMVGSGLSDMANKESVNTFSEITNTSNVNPASFSSSASKYSLPEINSNINFTTPDSMTTRKGFTVDYGNNPFTSPVKLQNVPTFPTGGTIKRAGSKQRVDMTSEEYANSQKQLDDSLGGTYDNYHPIESETTKDYYTPYDKVKPSLKFSGRYTTQDLGSGKVAIIGTDPIFNNRNNYQLLYDDVVAQNQGSNLVFDPDLSFGATRQYFANQSVANQKRSFGGSIVKGLGYAMKALPYVQSLMPIIDSFSDNPKDPYNDYYKKDTNPMRFATGGNIPIEAEGQEIVQEPNGEMYELQGPSHEQGGIDMNVPEGSQIYSKRLQGTDGKTMAERKAFREKRLAKLEALVKRNPNDKILRRTFEKTQKDFAKQEQEDMAYMNYMHQSQQMQQGQEEMLDPMQGNLEQENMFAMGGPAKKRAVRPIKYKSKLYNPRGEFRITDDFENPGFVINKPELQYTDSGIPKKPIPPQPINQDYEAYYDDNGNVKYRYLKSSVPSTVTPGIVENTGQTASNTNSNNSNSNSNNNDEESFWNKAYDALPTLGDAINLYGKYKAAYDPADMTLANRAGDTPNINPYENYGVRGLNKMEDVKNNLKNNLDQAVLNNQKNTNLYKSNAASNARSINTMRAMNLASEAQQLAADNAAYMQYAQQVAGIDSQIAQMINQQDQMQMSGNYQRDIADRQDRYNFNEQLQRDIATRNRGIQEIGKTLKDWKERDFNFQCG